jgi:hypothetical protein
MGKFCVKCGAPLNNGPFCVKCGTDMRSIGTPTSQSSQPEVQMPTAQPAQAPIPVPAKQGMSTFAKLGIAAVAIIFVGGAAGAVGVYYVAHRVSQKIHQTADGILGSTADSTANSSGNSTSSGESKSGNSAESGTVGDVCRFLSKQDVSKAIGVEIIRTESTGNGCSYLAAGTQHDMFAKHLKAMAADKGADRKSQDIAEKVTGGMMNMFLPEKRASELNTSGEVPVFNFSLDQHGAEEQIRLNAKVFSNLGSTEGIPGIGDHAFVSADGMMMVRKGKTLVTIMYLACPCGIEQVKPLAKQIADAL